jgi:signal transduction histidine kinase
VENKNISNIALFVDDKKEKQLSIEASLKSLNFQVVFCRNRQETVEFTSKIKPTIILVNGNSLGASVLDLVRDIKSREALKSLPMIVLISSLWDEDSRRQMIKLGVNDLVVEPFLVEEFKLRIKNHLDHIVTLRELENMHHNDKLVELGRLFTDLSHEVKNILHGASDIPKLQKDHIELAIAPIGLKDEFTQGLCEGFLSGKKNPDTMNRFNSLKDLEDPQLRTANMNLKGILAASSMSDDLALGLWSEIREMQPDTLTFFDNQLRLVAGFQSYAHIIERIRGLLLSALNYHRNTDSQGFCRVDRVWNDVFHLCVGPARKYSVTWQVEIPEVNAAISPSALTRILLNLCLNAIESMVLLEPRERWVRLSIQNEGEFDYIKVENGGPKIPQEIMAKLFTRGFSTKGASGSGIGLYISRGLAMQFKGDLICDSSTNHPTFVVSIPKYAQEKVA